MTQRIVHEAVECPSCGVLGEDGLFHLDNGNTFCGQCLMGACILNAIHDVAHPIIITGIIVVSLSLEL